MDTQSDTSGFWVLPATKVLTTLRTSIEGLAGDEAARRLAQHGPNRLVAKKHASAVGLLLGQFKSPITLLLLFAAILSFFLHDRTDAIIILIIVSRDGDRDRQRRRRAGGSAATLGYSLHPPLHARVWRAELGF